MHRTRRLASIAVIAMVGAVALAGCRSEPGVAAYFGDQEITEDQVTAVVDDAKRKLPEPSGSPDAAPSPDPAAPPGAEQPPGAAPPKAPERAKVVSVLVLGGICERLSADRGYQPQGEVPVEQVAQQLGVPGDSTYARLTADLYGCLSGIPADEQVTPTAEDLANLVARARSANLVPPGTSDADAGRRLDVPQYRSALATRKALTDATAEYDVVINPRYQPLEFPVLIFQGNIAAVAVPLGAGGPGTVTDLP